jgi:hypothetical protein
MHYSFFLSFTRMGSSDLAYSEFRSLTNDPTICRTDPLVTQSHGKSTCAKSEDLATSFIVIPFFLRQLLILSSALPQLLIPAPKLPHEAPKLHRRAPKLHCFKIKLLLCSPKMLRRAPTMLHRAPKMIRRAPKLHCWAPKFGQLRWRQRHNSFVAG